jgi:hypothetical protein
MSPIQAAVAYAIHLGQDCHMKGEKLTLSVKCFFFPPIFIDPNLRFIDSIATVIGRVRGELRSAVISKRFADYEMRFFFDYSIGIICSRGVGWSAE